MCPAAIARPPRECLLMLLHCRCLSLTVLAVALAAAALPAAAQRRDERQPPPAEPARQQRDDTVSDAVRRIERANRGQVLSAERMQYDGRDVTRIKVVDDSGRVRIYMDDPQPTSEPRRPPPQRDDTPPRNRDDD
jgi:hypothetical protein